VVTSGSVNTASPGTYRVTYAVTNSAGLSASVTRDVRILAPHETRLPRETFRFNHQGRRNDAFTNQVTALGDGILTLNVTVANNTSVAVRFTGPSGEVFAHTFSGNAARDIWLGAGTYTVSSTITEGNGNTSFSLNILTPEVIYLDFAEQEVPLACCPYYPDCTCRYELEEHGSVNIIVTQGATLRRIARALLGDGGLWTAIYNDNRAVIGPNPNRIHPGQVLTVNMPR
jgi:hypothetical protein